MWHFGISISFEDLKNKVKFSRADLNDSAIQHEQHEQIRFCFFFCKSLVLILIEALLLWLKRTTKTNEFFWFFLFLKILNLSLSFFKLEWKSDLSRLFSFFFHFAYFGFSNTRLYHPSLYYLGGKNLSAHLHKYLRLESTNHQKIGDIIKALQICKRLSQTASL